MMSRVVERVKMNSNGEDSFMKERNIAIGKKHLSQEIDICHLFTWWLMQMYICIHYMFYVIINVNFIIYQAIQIILVYLFFKYSDCCLFWFQWNMTWTALRNPTCLRLLWYTSAKLLDLYQAERSFRIRQKGWRFLLRFTVQCITLCCHISLNVCGTHICIQVNMHYSKPLNGKTKQNKE